MVSVCTVVAPAMETVQDQFMTAQGGRDLVLNLGMRHFPSRQTNGEYDVILSDFESGRFRVTVANAGAIVTIAAY